MGLAESVCPFIPRCLWLPLLQQSALTLVRVHTVGVAHTEQRASPDFLSAILLDFLCDPARP